jgi:hypothetical protein
MRTNKLFFLLVVVVVAFTCVGCGGGGSSGRTNSTGISGTVVDTSGDALKDVEVESGTKSTTTARDGSYTLGLQAGLDQIVSFTASGYVPSAMHVDVYKNATSYLPVTLMPMAAAHTLNSTTGGTVSGARGASITAPAGAFVDQDGNPISGNVNVQLTPLDPCVEVEAAAYPGELRGLTLDDQTVGLITDGVLDITVTKGGQTLELAHGQTLEVTIPAPSCGDAEDTSRTWYFDEGDAQWVEVDSEAVYDPASKTYAMTVDHLTSYNCDRPLDPSCVRGVVIDDDGIPVGGAEVEASQPNPPDSEHYNRGVYARTYTDTSGNFCMTAEREEQVLITVKTISGRTTKRVIKASEMRSNSYPADCSESSCKQLAPIVVGSPDEGESTEAECDVDVSSNNPFPYCYGLTTFYQCFHPEGACTYAMDFTSLNGGSYEITFENGSNVSYTSASAGMSYYGPDPFHDLCGVITGDGEDTIITTASDETIRIRTARSGGQEVYCNGAWHAVDADGQSAMMTCNGQPGEGSAVGCTPEPGTFLADCTAITDCDYGYECCTTPSSGGHGSCLPSGVCALYCVSDYDCGLTPGNVCCSNGFFDFCSPPEYCR